MAGADIERQCHGVIADVWRVVARSAEAGNQGELAEASVKQAYEHRARASEREKFYITTGYFELVTEEVEKRIEALELWKRMYPRDAVARNNFAAEYNDMGKFNEGLAEAQEAVRLAPSHYTAYEALGMAYLGLNRFAEAKEVRQKQLTLNVSNHWDHSDLYAIAVVENDTAGMQREIEWAKGKTYEFVLLRTIGEKLAAEGKAQDAREAYRRAVETARRGGFAILAKNRAVDLDLMETLLGHFSKTSHETQAAPGAFVHRSALETAGHVYAMRGDARRATAIADELVKRSPTGTYVNNVWAPSIRAELECRESHYVAPRSVSVRVRVASAELGELRSRTCIPSTKAGQGSGCGISENLGSPRDMYGGFIVFRSVCLIARAIGARTRYFRRYSSGTHCLSEFLQSMERR
jgi:tetratricopeptide (TPR) repeat protein